MTSGMTSRATAPAATRAAVSRARAAPAAAIVAKTVLGVVGIVGVARAIGLGDFGIVLAALVGVLDHQADRRAGGLALERAREDAHQVGLRRWVVNLLVPGLRASRNGWIVAFAQREARRAPVHHRAQRRPVAFAPGGEAQHAAKGVPAHGGGFAEDRAAVQFGERHFPTAPVSATAAQCRGSSSTIDVRARRATAVPRAGLCGRKPWPLRTSGTVAACALPKRRRPAKNKP